jgi:ethanolamine utilization protein
MYEDIIEEILKEVLHRLSEYENTCIHKKTLLVLSDEPYPLSEAITKEYNLLTPDFGSNQSVVELNTMVSCAEVILITSVTAKQLANLALLCGDGYLEEAIRYAHLLGKTIFVLEEGLEYRSYKATAHKAFYRKLLEYEECLKQHGMLFTTESIFPLYEKQVKQSVLRNQSENDKNITSYAMENNGVTEGRVELKKKLILEKDLMDLNVKSQTAICIEKGSIVTPSAFDYARAHRMRFIKM